MEREPITCAHCGFDKDGVYYRAVELGIEWCDPICCEPVTGSDQECTVDCDCEFNCSCYAPECTVVDCDDCDD